MVSKKMKKLVLSRRADRVKSSRGRTVQGDWTIDWTEYSREDFPDRPADAPTWYAHATPTVGVKHYGDSFGFAGHSREEVQAQIDIFLASERAGKEVAEWMDWEAHEKRRGF